MKDAQLMELLADNKIEASDVIEIRVNKTRYQTLLVVGIIKGVVYVKDNINEEITALQSITVNARSYLSSKYNVEYSLFRLKDDDNCSYVVHNFLQIVEDDGMDVFYRKLEDPEMSLEEHVKELREYLIKTVNEKKEKSRINFDYEIETIDEKTINLKFKLLK